MVRPGTRKDIAAERRAKSERLRATIDAFMRRKGLSSTEPRRLIIDEFLASNEHVTLDEMSARVKARDPSVGFSTVYRTMRLLVECGAAEEHTFGDRVARFEVASADEHHDHLICKACGAIFEFQEPRIERLQAEVAARFGFRQQTHKLEIYGECASCIAKADSAADGARPNARTKARAAAPARRPPRTR